MPRAEANGVTVAYETTGDPDDAPLLLMMGHAAPLTDWEPAFLALLVARGFFVVTYDHRDVGLSTMCEAVCPDPASMLRRLEAGEAVSPPYTLADLADDAAGLLDALAIESAHVLGASMGGMTAQELALRHRGRVRSLTLVMTAARSIAREPAATVDLHYLGDETEPDRESAIANGVADWRLLSGPGFAFEEARVRAMVARSYDREPDHAAAKRGSQRQMLAIRAADDRRAALASLSVSAVVVHGDADTLVPLSYGRELAASIPGAELVVVPGLGHELPSGVWGVLVEAVSGVAGRSG